MTWPARTGAGAMAPLVARAPPAATSAPRTPRRFESACSVATCCCCSSAAEARTCRRAARATRNAPAGAASRNAENTALRSGTARNCGEHTTRNAHCRALCFRGPSPHLPSAWSGPVVPAPCGQRAPSRGTGLVGGAPRPATVSMPENTAAASRRGKIVAKHAKPDPPWRAHQGQQARGSSTSSTAKPARRGADLARTHQRPAPLFLLQCRWSGGERSSISHEDSPTDARERRSGPVACPTSRRCDSPRARSASIRPRPRRRQRGSTKGWARRSSQSPPRAPSECHVTLHARCSCGGAAPLIPDAPPRPALRAGGACRQPWPRRPPELPHRCVARYVARCHWHKDAGRACWCVPRCRPSLRRQTA